MNFLENLKVPAYKIASNEFSDFPLIKRIAQTKKPVIMSTGTSKYSEIKETLNFASKHLSGLSGVLVCGSVVFWCMVLWWAVCDDF